MLRCIHLRSLSIGKTLSIAFWRENVMSFGRIFAPHWVQRCHASTIDCIAKVGMLCPLLALAFLWVHRLANWGS